MQLLQQEFCTVSKSDTILFSPHNEQFWLNSFMVLTLEERILLLGGYSRFFSSCLPYTPGGRQHATVTSELQVKQFLDHCGSQTGILVEPGPSVILPL